MPASSELWFATSNDHKFEEASFVMKEFDMTLRRVSSKGLEIQSDDPREIALHAVKETYLRFQRSLLTEDTGLFIRALGGFPGAYASHAYGTLGLGPVLKLVGAGNREAEFVSAVAYCGKGRLPRAFTGNLKGKLSQSPRGKGGFGFDPVFIPDGHIRTLAEMTMSEKCAISHRAKALRALAEWLLSGRRG